MLAGTSSTTVLAMPQVLGQKPGQGRSRAHARLRILRVRTPGSRDLSDQVHLAGRFNRVDSPESAEPPFSWEAMRRSAQQFAQAAVKNYAVQDAAFFYLHAGASVELSVKAALCRISPVLLVEGGQRFSDHALVRLTGFRPAETNAHHGRARQVFSVGFEAAIRRLQMLYGPDVLAADQNAIETLKAARDVTAHGGAVGEVGSETMLRVLDVLRKVHTALAPLLAMTPEEFWADSFNLVQEAERVRRTDLSRQVNALFKAAQYRFDKLCTGLDEETVQLMIDQAGQRVEPTEKDEYYRTCPVCGATGLSHERASKRTVVKAGKRRVERGWTATDFRCTICNLYFDTEELVTAADGFERWNPAGDDELLNFWAEDMGENLSPGDLRALGLSARANSPANS